jgi:SARP family transcriptional regulator, regulator of embCAB operon
LARARVQLCGRYVVEIDGRRVEDELPGRQGRLAFAFLVCARNRSASRGELLDALWPDGRDAGLAPLLSKLRRVVPLDGLRPQLANDAWVDVEAATDAVHRAESAVAQSDHTGAWGPAQVALEITSRPFLAGDDAPWIEQERRRLAELNVRALEAYAAATLGVGGTELAAAVRAARELTRREPYRESGWRLLMQALAAEGNTAEALQAYERLRCLLRDELGATPSPQTQQVHRALLASR